MLVQNLAINPAQTPELFSVFLEHAPVAVAMFDRQMCYLLASRQWLTDYDLSDQDLTGRSYYEVFPNLPEHWRELHQRCLAGAVERCDKDSFVRPDGKVEWVKWEARPWRYPTGEIGGLIVFTFITPAPETAALPEAVAQVTDNDTIKFQVSDFNLEWHPTQGSCTFENNPIVMMRLDTTLTRLMVAFQAMVGDKRFNLVLQREGRKSVEYDKQIISQFSNFKEGFAVIAKAAKAGGWGNWQLVSFDPEHKECRFQISNNWEGLYQKALGVCWGNGMLAGKLTGYCSQFFETNCWTEQTAFTAKGDEFDEFVVRPSKRLLENEIDKLLVCDETSCADLAVAWQNLKREISDRKRTEEALRASEARFQKLAANVPGAIYQFLLRPDGSRAIVYISSACRELYELEPEEIQENYERLRSLIHPDDLEALQESIFVSAETLTSRHHEARVITPSGKLKWIQAAARPEKLEGGEILWDGLLLDITERKQAEEQLQQYKEHLEELVLWRTAALTKANEQLQQEISERERTQEALLESQMRLELLHSISTDMNAKISVEQVIESTVNRVSSYFKTLRVAYSTLDDQGSLTVIHAMEPPRMLPLTGLVTNLSVAPDYLNSLYRDKLVLVEDVAQDSRMAPLSTAMLAGGTQALLNVPLQHSEKLLGLLCFNSPSPRKWSEHEIATLSQIAESLAIAIKKTRAQQERHLAEEALRQSEAKFRRLAKRETILNRLANQVRNSLDLNTIQQTLVDEIRELLQLDRCHITWYRPQLQPPVWEVVTEAKALNLPSHVSCYSTTEIGSLAEKLLRLELIREDSVETVSDPGRRQLLINLGYRAILALPIQTETGAVIILSCIHSSSAHQWTDDAVKLLQAVMAQLAIAITHAELYDKTCTKAQELEQALGELQRTQAQLVQSEKMSSLGQLVAGIAHEINNPVSFIYGNVGHASEYIRDLLNLLELYRATYPHSTAEIQSYQEAIELDFLVEDLPKLLDSMKVGARRIEGIVRSLRSFSRVDQSERKPVNLYEDLDNTLLILEHRLKGKTGLSQIEVIKEYGNLPLVECYAGQLNQVFMNLLTNAIDAIEESDRINSTSNPQASSFKPAIAIKTQVIDSRWVSITIADNGSGIVPDVLPKIFDLFFTTKPIGKGTGLGLAISYQIIVEKHRGNLHCHSTPGKGTKFVIEIPLKQP